MSKRIADFTEGGKCSSCGECCSNFLPLSVWEVQRIKKYIAKHGIKERKNLVINGLDLTCPFRDEAQRKCLIYEVRPEICRTFMCNHTVEDIMRQKLDYHSINKVYAMRREFFGNGHEIAQLLEILEGRRNV